MGEFEWYPQYAGPMHSQGAQNFHRMVARQPEVKAHLMAEAAQQAAQADIALNTTARKRTGASQIKVKQGDVDAHIIFDDPWAWDIEFGHRIGKSTKRTRGLYVLSRILYQRRMRQFGSRRWRG